LGDYVNRSSRGVEVTSLLFALKARYPDKITIIRGNHECRNITKNYGFYDEVIKKFNSEEVYEAFHEAFDYLPLAAVVNDKVFCVHGGISGSAPTLESINALPRG